MKEICEDQQKLLEAASKAHGLITMYLARAALLDLSDQMIRRHLDDLERKGYLRSGYVPQPEEWGDRLVKLYHTTKPFEPGGESGAAYLKRTKERQAKSEHPRRWKKGQTLPLPGRLWHDQVSASLMVAYGGPGSMFDFDFNRGSPPISMLKVCDGIAMLANGVRLALEVERMVRRTEAAWEKDRFAGLPISVHAWAGADPRNAHLLVTPVRLGEGLRRVIKRCDMTAGGRRAQGYYWLPYEDPWSDAVWVSLNGDTRPPLPGIRTMRAKSPRHLAAVADLKARRQAAAQARDNQATIEGGGVPETPDARKERLKRNKAKRTLLEMIERLRLGVGTGKPPGAKHALLPRTLEQHVRPNPGDSGA